MYQEWEVNGCQQKHMLYQWKEKTRKTSEEVDGQYKRRYGSKEHKSTSYGSGVVSEINGNVE